MTRQSIDTFRQYLAISLLFGVQAVDLRMHKIAVHYDARRGLSPATLRLYKAVREVVGRPPSADRPYIWNDNEQPLDVHIARIAADIADGGCIAQAVEDIVLRLSNI